MLHRLFVPLAALWCAALGGLGCLAAGGAAVSALLRPMHLLAIAPAGAQWPARLLLATIMAGCGGVIGLTLGRAAQRIARRARAAPPRVAGDEAMTTRRTGATAPRVRKSDAHPDAPPRRPLVVTEDVLPYATAMVAARPDQPDGDAPDAAPHPMAKPEADTGPALDDLPPFLAAAMSSLQRFDPAKLNVAPEPVALDQPALASAPPPQDDHDKPPVLAASQPQSAMLPPPVSPVAAAPPAAPAVPRPLASLAAAVPQVPLDQAPLAGLGLVHLAERLALAIDARRNARDDGGLRRAPVPPPPIPAAPPGDPKPGARLHDPLMAAAPWADDDDTDNAPPRFLRSPAVHADTVNADNTSGDHRRAVPAPRRALSPPDTPMPRPEAIAPVAPPPAPAMHEPPADPVVPFPFPRAATQANDSAPDDADQALRDALATLRRMSAHR